MRMTHDEYRIGMLLQQPASNEPARVSHDGRKALPPRARR
jgi:hypothetical protein